MDDLFQYLIWGLIIFSFLSSFLKKKEPPKQKTSLPKTKPPESVYSSNQQSEIDGVTTPQKQEEYDILQELEKLFKGEMNIPQQKAPQTQQSRDYLNREIGDKNLDEASDKRMQQRIDERRASDVEIMADKRTLAEQNKWQRKKNNIDPKIEASAKEFERVLEKPRMQRQAITEFNRKLKNPRTVREYILFSEILGKPKALRR